MDPLRTRTRTSGEDRVALGWPRLLGGVVQAAHYHMREAYSLLQGQGLHAASRSVALLPTPGLVALCRQGDANRQLTQRYRLASKLAITSRYGALLRAQDERRVCCVTSRVMAQYIAQMCGDTADATQARRQLRQMLLLVAPDKMQGLAAQVPGERVHAVMCRDAIRTLLFFRSLLDDPLWSAAIFAPGRLGYGQDGGPIGRCIGATLSVLAAWTALAWGAWKSLFTAPQAARRGAAILALTGSRPTEPGPLGDGSRQGILWGAAEQQTDSVFAPVIHLSTFRSFAALAQDPNQLSYWARTLDAAARGGACTAVVGLAVGYGLALPVWPLVLAGGVVGAVAMGAYQCGALRPANSFSLALTKMADIAAQAEDASPLALVGLRGKLQVLVRSHADAGTAIFVLAAKLDRLLAPGL